MGGVERYLHPLMPPHGHRVGLLGGTFDPPHLGHLWLAEVARAQLGLDQVLFLPVGQPPHKNPAQVTAVDHRQAMLQLAIADNPTFRLDTSDMDRPLPHTTVSLLPLLQQAYPTTQFWWLIGSDSLRDLPTWTEPERLVQLCRLAVLPRPGVEVCWEELTTAVPGVVTAVDWLEAPALSLSSTAIRHWLCQGYSARYVVGTAVADYIQQHHLYRAMPK